MAASELLRSRGTLDERVERGIDARRRVPHDVHSDLYRAQARPDPIALIRAQDEGRIPRMLPLRYQRLSESLHGYFRGTASVMAADLSVTPVSGISAQAVGNADVLNFGRFAVPERGSVFDVADFDETLRGPWEWDIKRMAASMAVYARSAGAPLRDQRSMARAAVTGYRRGMAWAAGQDRLRLWFARIPDSEVERGIRHLTKPATAAAKQIDRLDVLRHLEDLTEVVGGVRRIVPRDPVLVPLNEWLPDEEAADLHNSVVHLLSAYANTVGMDIQEILSEYRPVDMALRVTGVAEVGLRCLVVLLQGAHADEWMLLQAKEAGHSVLQPYVLPEFRHRGSQGRRVVQGQSVLQAARDPLLGWARSADRDYYVRQIWASSASVLNVPADPNEWARFARLCGYSLARGHAVTGDRVAIDAYLGDGETFEKAVSRYAVRYADLVEADHADFCKALADGSLPTP